MYTIILNDGTQLQNLTLNGNNFVASTAIEDSIFSDNMSTVTILNAENNTSETIEDAILFSNITRDGKSWIVIGEKPIAQKTEEISDRKIAELCKALNVLLMGGN